MRACFADAWVSHEDQLAVGGPFFDRVGLDADVDLQCSVLSMAQSQSEQVGAMFAGLLGAARSELEDLQKRQNIRPMGRRA